MLSGMKIQLLTSEVVKRGREYYRDPFFVLNVFLLHDLTRLNNAVF